jgi:hypothetical protein
MKNVFRFCTGPCLPKGVRLRRAGSPPAVVAGPLPPQSHWAAAAVRLAAFTQYLYAIYLATESRAVSQKVAYYLKNYHLTSSFLKNGTALSKAVRARKKRRH